MISIVFRTLILYVFLTIILKIMGKRQLGELEVGELVSTLLISEVAAIPMEDPDLPLLGAILPIFLIVCFEILISAFKNKSSKLKKVIEGEPIFLIYRGKIRQNALKSNRISLNELLSEIRQAGVGDFSAVPYCILEANGKISVLQKPSDGSDPLFHAMILDGEINKQGLKALGYGEEWLQKQISPLKPDEIFLFTVSDSGKTEIVKKEGNPA